MTMKSSLHRCGWCLLAVFLCNVAVRAQEKKEESKPTDPSGTWRWTHDEGGETVKDVLKLNFDEREVTGSYQGRVASKVEKARVDGNQLFVEFHIEADGQKIGLKFEGKIDGDDVVGKVVVENFGEFPWTAKRTLEAADVVGSWNITLKTDDGQTFEPVVKIRQEGDQLKGVYISKLIDKELELKDLRVKDKKLTFEVSGDANGNSFTLKYSGEPRGDRMSGKVSYTVGGQSGELAFKAIRPEEKPKDAPQVK